MKGTGATLKGDHPNTDRDGLNASLGARLRQAGIVLISCTLEGEFSQKSEVRGQKSEIRDSTVTSDLRPLISGSDWLRDLFCRSALFARTVEAAAACWATQEEPQALEAMAGVWLVPIALMERRRRTGYDVAVIATEALLESEHISALCQASQTDERMCRRMLQQLPLTTARGVMGLATLVRQAHEEDRRARTDRSAIESMGKNLAESMEELHLLVTLTQNMKMQEPPERFAARTCSELLATLPYAWIGLVAAGERKGAGTEFSACESVGAVAPPASHRNKLKGLGGRVILAGSCAKAPAMVESLMQPLFGNAQAETPIVLEPARNSAHVVYAGLGQTVLAYPVSDSRNGEVIGLLLAGDKQGADGSASNIDIKLLGAAATQFAVFLENAALFDDLNAMFLGTLEALTASIDAKDRYTCGHSRRVAHLTQALASAIGIDEYTVGRCRVAGLVHDVGKIGVPETVLLKPGKLNDEEFAWIKKHPEMGYRILKDIPQLSDVLPGVLYHHERWDGRGYPHGLSGEGIPLLARLIGLADSFDAMSSTRTYRSAMSRSQVLTEIDRCAGGQFDPELAKAFLRLDFSEYDRLAQEHQASETSGARQAA